MNRSTPGLPVHQQLPEFTQTHVHRVGDSIQPSHPLSSPSPPAPNHFQHQSLLQWVTLCMRWPNYWSFSFSIIPSKEIPGLISFRMDWLDPPCSPRDSQESSPTPLFKSINTLPLSCSLCILDINSLSDIWLENMFSPSLNCLLLYYLFYWPKAPFILMPSHFPIFAFVVCVYAVISKKSLLRPMSRKFFPMFSSSSLTISSLMFINCAFSMGRLSDMCLIRYELYANKPGL